MLKLRKNKIVIPVILLTTLISITSVGLSAWLIRVDESTKLFEANLVIEGVVTKIATLEVTNKTEKIVFNGASGNGIVKGDSAGEKPQQNVDVSYTIITHKDNLDTLVQHGLDLSIKVTKNGSGKDYNDYVQTTDDTLFGRTQGTTYTLVELNTTHIPLDETKFTTYKNNVDFKTTTLTSSNGDFLKINYGSYFDNKTPDVFYSEKIQAYQDAYYKAINTKSNIENARDNYFNSISQTNNELNKIKEILNGSTITITSKVSVD